jgi:hypothetical protein
VENAIEIPLSERFEVAFNQIHKWMQKNIRDARSDKQKQSIYENLYQKFH